MASIVIFSVCFQMYTHIPVYSSAAGKNEPAGVSFCIKIIERI